MSDSPPPSPIPPAPPAPAVAPHVLSYQSPDAARQPSRVWMVSARFIYVVFGLLVPAICFIGGSDRTPLSPDWQDRRISSQIALLLDGRNGWPFYALIAYAMICMALLIVWPRAAGRSFFARLGIYGGVLISFYYAMVMGAALFKPSNSWIEVDLALLGLAVLLAAAFPIGMGLLLRWVMTRWSSRTVWKILAFTAGFIVLCLVLLVLMTRGAILFLLIVLGGGGGPLYALIAYTVAAIEVLRRAEDVEPWPVRSVLAALLTGAFGISLAAAIRNALVSYAALPRNPPGGCYVCTAATRGHRRIVGAIDTHRGHPVNRQMRILKAGEIAIATLSPRTHRAMRFIYDRLGPRLAARLTHPLLADVAYLTLKPFELVTFAVLRLAVPSISTLLPRLYPADSSR